MDDDGSGDTNKIYADLVGGGVNCARPHSSLGNALAGTGGNGDPFFIFAQRIGETLPAVSGGWAVRCRRKLCGALTH